MLHWKSLGSRHTGTTVYWLGSICCVLCTVELHVMQSTYASKMYNSYIFNCIRSIKETEEWKDKKG
jgi:hypothetical protein